jgi:ribosomal protein S8
MFRSYSKIRHIQEANQRLENRLLNEQSSDKSEEMFKTLSKYGFRKGDSWIDKETKSKSLIKGDEKNGIVINITTPNNGTSFYKYTVFNDGEDTHGSYTSDAYDVFIKKMVELSK